MKITEKYIFFYKEEFSQWHKSSFSNLDDIIYNCCEQYMMSEKALLFNDKQAYDKIMKATHPREIQKLGREIKNYNQEIWDKWKYEIVCNGNYLKFIYNFDLLKLLLETGSKKFVEASPIDKIWGIGMDENHPDIEDETKWQGENLLGKALTETKFFIFDTLANEKNLYKINK